MIRIHKEGRVLALSLILVLAVINLLMAQLGSAFLIGSLLVSAVVLYLVLQFFRNPVRVVQGGGERVVIAPADGKICAIEEVFEPEYFKDKRLQVSIFMSPFNVHVNRNPVSGAVQYFKYHPGKYLVAWHPKSSEENERTTLVYRNAAGEILMRQIAGAVARRIRWYVKEGDQVSQGADMGFIKFGSRVDLFLPLNAQVNVKMDDIVKGNLTTIATL